MVVVVVASSGSPVGGCTLGETLNQDIRPFTFPFYRPCLSYKDASGSLADSRLSSGECVLASAGRLLDVRPGISGFASPSEGVGRRRTGNRNIGEPEPFLARRPN